MRKLVYVCTKANSVVKVSTMAQANELRLGGWNVTEVLESIPEPDHCAPKQWAQRVVIPR